VKADGLALGKGVRVCATREEALAAADELIRVSGSLVLEERLSGEEVSWLAFSDGKRCALLEPARDFKRLRDGDQGPNTGGMGAFSPVPGMTPELGERIRREVILPTLAELARRGTPFRGVLYAGLMVDPARDKFWVIEFNSRFGDPETQVLLPRMAGDLYEWCLACARGDLGGLPPSVPFSRERGVFVVGAARGYPESPEKGARIEGDLSEPGERDGVFVAGARREGAGHVTSGGRVLGALGLGPDFAAARERAYARLGRVRFEGMQFRKDIAAGVSG
jgi:phosphoribosylamine--glycine ligase